MSVYSDLILGHPAIFAYWRLADAAFPMTDEVGSLDGTRGGASGSYVFQQFGALFNDPNTGLENLATGTDYVEFPFNLRQSTGGPWDYVTPGGFSLEAWRYKPIAAAASKDASLIGGWSGGGLMIWDSFFTGEWGVANNSSTYYLESNVPPALDGWDHLVCVYDPAVGTDGFLYLYVNGVERASLDVSTVISFSPKWDVIGNPPMRLFAYNGGNILPGIVDEAAMYSAALTPDEIKEHYLVGLRELEAFPNVCPMDEFPDGSFVANWVYETVGITSTNFNIVSGSGQATAGNFNTYCDAYPFQDQNGHGGGVFGPDIETWIEVTRVPDNVGWDFGQWIGIVNPATTNAEGYGWRATPSALEILRLDRTLAFTVLASVAWTPDVGHYGISRVGSLLTLYVDWVPVLSVNDATYSAPGVCGMFMTTPAFPTVSYSARVQRFAAGTYTPPPSGFVPQVISYMT